MLIFVVATPLRHRDLNIFLISEALLRCRVFIVAKLKNCRMPSSEKTTFTLQTTIALFCGTTLYTVAAI